MRLRCHLGIHDWKAWELIREYSIYYTQRTSCRCCGKWRQVTAVHYRDFTK